MIWKDRFPCGVRRISTKPWFKQSNVVDKITFLGILQTYVEKLEDGLTKHNRLVGNWCQLQMAELGELLCGGSPEDCGRGDL